MLRWYLWLAMLFAVPLAAVFLPLGFLGDGSLPPRSMLTALGFGLVLSGIAVAALGGGFRDDHGRPLAVTPRTTQRAMAGALVAIPLLVWSGFCGCLGAALVRLAFDEPGGASGPAFSWPDVLMFVAAFVPGLLIASWIAVSVRREGKPTASNRLGLCAQCGYHLRGLPITTDGVQTCPECGAAWRQREDPESL